MVTVRVLSEIPSTDLWTSERTEFCAFISEIYDNSRTVQTFIKVITLNFQYLPWTHNLRLCIHSVSHSSNPKSKGNKDGFLTENVDYLR